MTLDRRTLLFSAATAAAAGVASRADAAPVCTPRALAGGGERLTGELVTGKGLIIDLARDPDAEIPLWPDGPPGGENVSVVEEIVHRDNVFGLVDRAAHNVTRPTLTRFDAECPDGSALLIIPGGGYSWVVIDKEGFEGARWFSKRGVTVYVLRHRLPHQGWAAGPDTPLQDAQRALRLVRSRASQDGFDPHRIGVMGFSAGGHVAGSLATRFDARVYDPVDAADALSARPDVATLVYPVATMRDPFVHAGSRTNLLGEHPSTEAIAAYSLETAPPAEAPPTFLFHAADDLVVPVENSINLFLALKNQHTPTELHVFQSGGHGFGLRGVETNTSRVWPELYLNWAATHDVYDPGRLRL